MNNTVFGRISKLFSQLGINMTSGSENTGEARAYAAGFELVNTAFDNVFKNIYIQTADDTGLRMFLSLIDEKPQEDIEESRMKVMDRFMKDGAFLDYDEFEEQFNQIAPEADFMLSGNFILISDFVKPVTPENLIRAGRFLKKYAPALSFVYLTGRGLSFESYDNLEMRWFELDEVNMPFHMLDGLE